MPYDEDDPVELALGYIRDRNLKSAQDILAGHDRQARRVFRQTLRLAARLERGKDWPRVMQWLGEPAPEDDGRFKESPALPDDDFAGQQS